MLQIQMMKTFLISKSLRKFYLKKLEMPVLEHQLTPMGLSSAFFVSCCCDKTP